MTAVDGNFFPPLEYSVWFPWAGLGLLVLVGAWYAYVLLSTRRRPAPQAVPTLAAPDLARLRRGYLQRIDAVDREAAAGTRSSRSSHQELSLLVRSFVRDASGVDATRMTLADLRAHSDAPENQAAHSHTPTRKGASSLPAAAEAVAAMYPAAFAAGPPSHVPDAAQAARMVVQSWN